MSDEKVDAWMPLWIGAYLADTMHLTTQQHGAYLLLLFAYWRNKGPLLDDDEDLASIAKAPPAEWRRLRPKIERFFSVADGLWSHGRADKELAAAGLRKANAVSKAKAAAEARWKKEQEQSNEHAPSNAKSNAQAVHKECPTPSPKRKRLSNPSGSHPAAGVERFDAFWSAYPRKVGKDAARKAFAKRAPTAELLGLMLAAISTQRSSEQWKRDDGQYIPHPSTWLNEGRWQDEVPVAGHGFAEDWWSTRSGIERKGMELGLGPWDQDAAERGRGEQFAAYEARVYRTAGPGPWQKRDAAPLGAGILKAVAA